MTKHLAVTRERLAEFQQKTKDDAVLQQLKQTIELGWPERRKAVPSEIRAYYSYQDEILFRGNRVVVPAAMRKSTQATLALRAAFGEQGKSCIGLE